MDMGREMNYLKEIRYLVIDVDGTMTDAGIYYDENGNELKKFCTRDAAGFFAARQAGIQTLVLTGRACQATARRMQEMKVDFLVQNCKDKVLYLEKFMQDKQISKDSIGYLGDDLNDLAGMRLCGFCACPQDACEEVKRHADYISSVKGGYGAVRDIICHLLKERGEWADIIEQIYCCGT